MFELSLSTFSYLFYNNIIECIECWLVYTNIEKKYHIAASSHTFLHIYPLTHLTITIYSDTESAHSHEVKIPFRRAPNNKKKWKKRLRKNSSFYAFLSSAITFVRLIVENLYFSFLGTFKPSWVHFFLFGIFIQIFIR